MTAVGGYRRRLGSNLAAGAAGQVVQLASAAFLVAYLVRRLGAEQWGLVALAMSAVSVLSLVQVGASTGIARKLNHFLTIGDAEEFARHYAAGAAICLSIGALLALLLAALLTVFWPWMRIAPAMAREGRLVFAAIGLSAVSTTIGLVPGACFQAMHRIDVYAKIDMASALLRLVASVALFELFSPKASTYALVFLACSLLSLGAGLWWTRRALPQARFRPALVDGAVLRGMVAFNLMTMFNTVNHTLFLQAPVFLLQRYAGLGAAGLYGIALQVNNLMRSLFTAGSNSLSPPAISLVASGRFDRARDLFRVWTRCYAGTAVMMWAGLTVFRRPILELWVSRGAGDLPDLLPWMGGAAAAGILAIPSAVFLVATERLRLSSAAGAILAAAMAGLMAARFASAAPARPLVEAGALLAAFFGAYQLLRVREATLALDVPFGPFLAGTLLRSVLPAAILLPVIMAASAAGLASRAPGLLAVTAATAAAFAALSWRLLLDRAERAELLDLLASFRERRDAPAAEA